MSTAGRRNRREIGSAYSGGIMTPRPTSDVKWHRPLTSEWKRPRGVGDHLVRPLGKKARPPAADTRVRPMRAGSRAGRSGKAPQVRAFVMELANSIL